jgi:acyl-CoA thioesterase-1
MQQMTGFEVTNLALPGAGVMEAQAMADKVTPDDRVVLIEIGGNDLLGGVPSDEFGRGLEAIAAKLAAPERTLVMFELPLLPHKIAYGQIQRRIAAKYVIWLIPKHYFVELISGENASSDGLHLSDTGGLRMAAIVAHALSTVLKSHDSNTTAR